MSKVVSPARLRRRARVRLLQKVQHALPGGVLLGEGVQSIREGVRGWHFALSVTEIATCAIVFIALVRAIRGLRAELKAGGVPHLHVGIDWTDIFLGAMLFTEAWAKYLENGHIQRPTILLAVVMLFLGVFGGKFIAWKHRDTDKA